MVRKKDLLILIMAVFSIYIYAEPNISSGPDKYRLDDSVGKLQLFDQSNEHLVFRYFDSNGYHAVLRVTGYTKKDIGAANKKEDSLVFAITRCSESARTFLIERRSSRIENGEMIIDLAVPHEFDPEHIVKKSTREHRVIVVVNVMGDFNRGGWDNTNKLMMFQKEEDLMKQYKDDFDESEYDHFYDDL